MSARISCRATWLAAPVSFAGPTSRWSARERRRTDRRDPARPERSVAAADRRGAGAQDARRVPRTPRRRRPRAAWQQDGPRAQVDRIRPRVAGWPRARNEQQDRAVAGLRDAAWRYGLRPQSRRRSLQDAAPRAVGAPRRAG